MDFLLLLLSANSGLSVERHWIPPYQVRGKLNQARNDKIRKAEEREKVGTRS
jgi:hypothetical protein